MEIWSNAVWPVLREWTTLSWPWPCKGSAAPAESLHIYGAWWDSSKNLQRAQWCHCKASLDDLWWSWEKLPADLLAKSDFLLQHGNPPTWSWKASRCHIFRLQQSFWYRFSHSISLDQVSTFSWRAVTQSVSNQLTSQAERVLVNEVTSGWQLVTGVVLHSSIFTPVLFNIFINALDTGPGGILSLPKASHWGELSNP